MVARALVAAMPELAAEDAVEIVTIRTTGDAVVDRPLALIGGKGLFTKEIDDALLAGRIDLAVHSMKDVPTRLPDAIVLAAMLPREDPRDVLIGGGIRTIAEIPRGACIGTASLRRQAQVLAKRPDLRVTTLRGNVHTRLAKVEAGAVAATFLALAGLKRLGFDPLPGTPLSIEEMLPAVGQGAIGITCRRADRETRAWLAALDDATTSACVTAERALLAALDGSCRTPIAGLARIGDGRLELRAQVAEPSGRLSMETTRAGTPGDATTLGRDAGEELRARFEAAGGRLG